MCVICVCVSDVGYILEHWNRASVSLGQVDAALFLSISEGGYKKKTYSCLKHTHTRLKKNTHAPPLSHIPPGDLACHILSQLLEAVLIREPFTLSLCCSHPSLTPTLWLPSQTLQSWKERAGAVTFYDLSGCQTTTQQSASLSIMVTNWKMAWNDLKWVYGPLA